MFKKNRVKIIVALITTGIMLSVSLGLIKGIDDFWKNSKDERIQVAETAIKRAALQCYALEGSYPPDLKYLEDNYGILLNEDRYFYQYSFFASNIMPDIVVLEKPR